MSKHNIYAAINKVDDNGDGTIDVHGIASTEAKDSQGETVTKGCMQDALPDYFAHGTGALRAMHQPIAAGYVYKAEVNSEGQTLISAKVVDPVEVLKCTTGVYKGFSIGGKKVPGGYDSVTKTISKMKLTEISLVDRPANPEATITMWKGEDMDEQVVDVTVTKEAEVHINALAEIINKGEITPERLVELANADLVAKVAAREDVSAADKAAAKKEYGDVKFADEKNKKYPIDTEAHIRAAWNYINKEKNAAKYSADEAKTIKANIVAAWKKTIDKEGPPAAADTAKAETEEDIKKGIYSLKCFADILCQIQYLTSDAIYEAKYEGDTSGLPAALIAWLETGVGIMTEMTAEETSEMLESLKAMQPPVAVEIETEGEGEPVSLADLELDIIKALDAAKNVGEFVNAASPHMDEMALFKSMFMNGGSFDSNRKKLTEEIAKAGARNSKADVTKIQSMHDQAVELGAMCTRDTQEGASGKHDHTGDIAKVTALESDIAKLTDERDTLTKRVKELEDMPAPSKATLRIINKVDDIAAVSEEKQEGPILKDDGSIDHEATALDAIKKMHQTGGKRMLR
jgi:hypothetical protein